VRILVVEDERKVAKALEQGLEAERYEVAVAHTGEDGCYLISTQSFVLVLLDLMLPGRSGLEILRAMRTRGLKTPVLILTARDAIEDRVQALTAVPLRRRLESSARES
jgi:DNA-binding response OmpR family regulator